MKRAEEALDDTDWRKKEQKKIIQAGRQKSGNSFEVTWVLVLIKIISDRQILAGVQCCFSSIVLLLKLVTI